MAQQQNTPLHSKAMRQFPRLQLLGGNSLISISQYLFLLTYKGYCCHLEGVWKAFSLFCDSFIQALKLNMTRLYGMRFVFCVQFGQIYSKPRRFFVYNAWRLKQSHSPSPSRNLLKYANVFLWRCFLVYGMAPNEILNNNRTWNFYSLWTIVNFWIRCICGYCFMMTVLAISKGYPVCSEAQPNFLFKQSCHCNLQ